MAIVNDLSHLPRRHGEGLQPDAHPRFIQVLVEKWAAESLEDKPHAIEGTRFRGSDAGKCARQIAYKDLGLPRQPMDLSGVFNTNLGTLLHDAWQEALQERFPGAQIEVKTRIDDCDGSMHIDAVLAWPDAADVPEQVRGPGWSEGGDYVISYELKSIGGWGFKNSIGRAKSRTADGPRSDHLYQAAFGGAAMDAHEVIVGYLAKEALGKKMRVDNELDRFVAEWTFTREQYEPLAAEESARVARIQKIIDDGEVPARHLPEMPDGAKVMNPAEGIWELWATPEGKSEPRLVDHGVAWLCDYCDFQEFCATTPAGRTSVVEIRRLADPFTDLPDSSTPAPVINKNEHRLEGVPTS